MKTPSEQSTIDQVAVVTGAGRGIGSHIALGLASAGVEVILVSRSRSDLESVAVAIAESGGRARVVPADVSSAAQVRSLAEALSGSVAPSILVNAAGVFGPIQPIVDTEPADWFNTMQVNLFGAYLTCRAFAPGMMRTGWGRILNVTSAAALHTPGTLNSSYGTSKVALNQFTRHLAAELEGTGVTANVFHPGDVKTDMYESIRKQVDQLGPAAEFNYGPWVEWVGRTGGDPPQKAVDLVMRVITDHNYRPNGKFLWIDNPLQAPIPSWSTETESDLPPVTEQKVPWIASQ